MDGSNLEIFEIIAVKLLNEKLLSDPMTPALNLNEIAFILESLNYTKLRFESTSYPSYDLKQEQLKRVEEIQVKLRKLRDSLNES